MKWAIGHKTKFFGVVIAAIVLGAAWAVYGIYSDSRENKAFADLAAAQAKLHDVEVKLKVTDTVNQGAGSLDSDYKEVVESLKNVLQKHKGTNASVFAGLSLAQLYSGHKSFADEVSTLQSVAETACAPATRALVRSRLGVALSNNNQCDKAVPVFQSIEDDKHSGFLKGFTLIQKGLCLERLGQTDKALESLKKAEAQGEDQEASRTAKKFIRALGGKKS
jgi:predicted negative regulator of RcsB-dependent stress response